MIVSELIELLQHMPQDQVVILSADDEGNSFRELLAFAIFPDQGWDPYLKEVGLLKLTPRDRAQGYTEEDILEDGVPCLILG